MHINYKTIALNKPTFPGSLFHVPSPTRGIFLPVLRTAKSLILILCAFREDTKIFVLGKYRVWIKHRWNSRISNLCSLYLYSSSVSMAICSELKLRMIGSVTSWHVRWLPTAPTGCTYCKNNMHWLCWDSDFWEMPFELVNYIKSTKNVSQTHCVFE